MSDSAQTGVLDQLAALGKQNGATIGRILANGNLGMAEEGPDGKMHATIRINEDELVYDPTVLVLPHGGELEIEFFNDDKNTHCAVLPSNGDTKFLVAGQPFPRNRQHHPGRPGLLLVRVDHWQRRGAGPDRSDRRRGRHARRGQARPSTPAATVERSRRWQLSPM